MPSDFIPTIENATARRLFLHHHGLGKTDAGKGGAMRRLEEMTGRLGFVQIDSINTVSRAHHMILQSRLPGYRESQLKRLCETERKLFEHWTHDASFISIGFYPHWKLKFERDRERLSARWQSARREGFEQKFEEVLTHIATHGPATSADVGQGEARSSGGWWDWHPSKTALEFLWRTGALSVARRDGFKKVYDLTENVIPAALQRKSHSLEETIEFACSEALTRLGFATPGELAAFFDLISVGEAKAWASQALSQGRVCEAQIQSHNGDLRPCLLFPETLDRLQELDPSPGKIRILSPFDPMLRDRQRALRLFGFDYRIEVFVPEAQRRYGYYVFPVLQGEKVIGRIDMKADRKTAALTVKAYWPEPGASLTKARLKSLETALARLLPCCGLDRLSFDTGWQRQHTNAA